ncbi:unnamed protein product [Rotaria sordida]|uniref:Uncharacterized protein n=1 Tax=Rotaria sordida TaxID=392033 RepID=A0A818TQS4_9BILA|nr:unnamed protein product [Rotaria sordida]CAF3682817.1 unnamed protein product [Rotaria sordida]
MNVEPIRASPTISTEEPHPLSLPLFLSLSSSSLKPLRERNRTNLKRRINLSRSQVLSTDFENEDNLSTTNNINKITTNSQPPSTPTIHTHTELYSKTISPKTPSPIHTTVTCSQVWERLASNEEHQNSTSSQPNITPTTSTSSLPTHISFSYDPSDNDNDDEGEEISHDDKDDFQYVPVSSQSKLVQFQFLTFARQQQLDLNSEDEEKEDTIIDQNMPEEDEDDDDEKEQEEEEIEQENRISKKRKRSISTTHSLDNISTFATTDSDTIALSSISKQPRTKKPKIKDPNANFQRLNMRKKHFSHAKKHQVAKHKRNAFYRRMRHAGGNK